MPTIQQTFIEKHHGLASASIVDRRDCRLMIETERGLYCGRCEAPALVRVFRPRTGENSRANAIVALLVGDLVSELRCDICVFLEDAHVVEHLCPCGQGAQVEVEAAWSMYEAIRRRYSAALWREIPGSYYTYRMCASCAEDIEYNTVSPLREIRPGPDQRAELNALFSRSKALHDLGYESFAGLTVALTGPPGSRFARTVRWIAHVEQDVFPHVREPSSQDRLDAHGLVSTHVAETESKVREARVWLADTRERRQALLDRNEGRELDPTDTCEIYEMDKTVRRLTEFIDGDSAYLAIARAVVSNLGS